MSSNERLKSLEKFYETKRFNGDIDYLINRVKRLTKALEKIKTETSCVHSDPDKNCHYVAKEVLDD